MCGEKDVCRFAVIVAAGSPPRVRGKAEVKRIGAHSRGITPACAGKSAIQDAHRYTALDHPRVCGEKENKNG